MVTFTESINRTVQIAMKNKAAQSLARLRWEKIPPEQRSQFPHNPTGIGGRPRKYPQCPRYKAHRFGKTDRCPCGYER